MDLPLAIASVSRRHALVDYREGAWILRDLGSRNGTFVGGRRVTEAALAPSALVRLGDGLFKFVAAGVESYAPYDLDGTLVGEPFEGAPLPVTRLCGGYRMHRLARALLRLSSSRVGVVLAGERGAEKERCSLQLHEWRRREGAFVRIGCAGRSFPSIAAILAASALDRGTVLFDDADDLSREDVAEVRHVLDGHDAPSPTARGGPYRSHANAPRRRPIDVDVVIGLRDPTRPAACLAAPDPAYVLAIPPLRERKENLRAHTRQILRDLGHPGVALELGFMLGLAHHDFPGDVEELAAIVRVGCASAGGASLGAAHLPVTLRERMLGLYGQ
jgi:hypothetical protein